MSQTINHVLLMDVHEAAWREARPTAEVIDSQSVKTNESGSPLGYVAEKMIKGRKRHILTDHRAAGWNDRPSGQYAGPRRRPGHAGKRRTLYPWLRHVFADGVYAGDN